jgi:uncharacterized glyoxalase superfamily protein PhnB
MKFSYVIVYVPDVPKIIEFYERAFGLKLKFLHESNQYAEMETGTTALAFAEEKFAAINKLDIRLNRLENKNPGIELAFVAENVTKAFEHATKLGAKAIVAPEKKPWGQTVAYVADLNGVLVEICSPMV